jgi:hypothetical protein
MNINRLAITISVLAAIMAAPTMASASSIKLLPAKRTVTVNIKSSGLIKTSKKCRITAPASLGLSKSRIRSGYRWNVKARRAGKQSIKVSCGRSKRLIHITAKESAPATDTPESDAPDSTPIPDPTPDPSPTSKPKLTGSDAEAELAWQQQKAYYIKWGQPGGGICSDYVYMRRPDIPERITKAAYKQWVADGAVIPARHSGTGKDKVSTNPTDYFAVAYYYGTANWSSDTYQENVAPFRILPDPSPFAWTVGARRAGLTISQTPFPGAVMIQANQDHVAYVEAVYPPDEWDLRAHDTGHYIVSEANVSGNKGKVTQRSMSVKAAITDGTFFVG